MKSVHKLKLGSFLFWIFLSFLVSFTAFSVAGAEGQPSAKFDIFSSKDGLADGCKIGSWKCEAYVTSEGSRIKNGKAIKVDYDSDEAWGGWRIELPKIELAREEINDNSLIFYINGTGDSSGNHIGKEQIIAKITLLEKKKNVPGHHVVIGGPVIDGGFIDENPDTWQLVNIPLKKLIPHGYEKAGLRKIVFQFRKVPEAGVAITDVSIRGKTNGSNSKVHTPRSRAVSEKSKKNSKKYAGLIKNKDIQPVTEDRYTRPKFKDGIVYRNGQPDFYISVLLARRMNNVTSVKEHSRDYPKEVKKYPYYNRPIDNKMLETLGIDGIDFILPWGLFFENDLIDKSHPLYENIKKLWCLYIKRTGEVIDFSVGRMRSLNRWLEFAPRFKETPLIADFASGHKKGWIWKLAVKEAGLPEETIWRHPYESDASNREFPFNFNSKIGRGILASFYMGGAKCLLDNGLNPWLYMFAREVHDYNNPDSKNMKGFVGYLKKKFGTIEALNSAWRTSFKDFNDILVEKPGPSSLVKGMWFDWRLYMGKEFAEQIKWIKDRFREVDQRKNTYIGFMNAVWALKNQYNSIIDIYETAKVTDFYSLEGGVNFGEQPKSLDKISTNQLTAIFRLRGRFNSQLFHDIGRAIFPRKPIFNVETYTERTHKGMEVKIKKSDIITNLWNEVIHGSSGANFYGWRSVSGIDTKEKAMGNSFPSLLNPYKTPPEALDGFKKFNSEIGPIKNILLPRPRIEGEIALLISRVSRWNGVRTDQSKGLYYNYYQKIITAYGGLMQTHYPLDVLYEADLASKGDDYKAIVIPGYSYMFAGTYPKLKKYVGNGGTLVILGDAYKYDEYGRDMNISKLTGVRIKDDFVTEKKEIQLFDFSHCYEDISITTSARIKPLTSRVIGTDSSDAPFATKNSYGKGTVYYIAGDSIGVDAQYELFARILKDAGVRKDFKVVDDKGKAFDDVEAQVIDRGKNRIYYIVDWQNFSVRKGYLKITEPYKKTYIYDVIRQAYIADTSGNIKWSKKSLIDRGFPIAMEGQVRNVFLVSSKPVMKQEKIIGPDDINRNVNSLKQKVKEQKKDFDDFVRMVKPYR